MPSIAVRAATCGVAVALAACSTEQARRELPPAGDSVVAPEIPETTLAFAMRQPWTGDFDSMRLRRMIRVLVPMSPTYFFYDGLHERGITAETFRRFEYWLNERFGTQETPTAIVFLPTTRENLLPELLAGNGDIAAGGIAVTERRQQAVEFTRPVAEGIKHFVVTGPGAPPLARLEDLSGHEVYIGASTAYAEEIIELNRRLAEAGRPPVTIRPANPDLEEEDILEMVNAGVVPITIASSHLAEFWDTVLDSITVRPDLELAGNVSLAFAVRRTSSRLADILDQFVTRNRIGTGFGNTVMRRYLVTNRWVRGTDATAERQRVQATLPFFRRYAGEYDLDYLLLMAQGFQESQLKQDARSHVGAMGVMQLMPRTASSPPISIPNVGSSMDANIKAGAKYMRHVIDDYFADSSLTRFNRMVFALAAYNAGPNRINSLRRVARRQGLDGDVWFRNVELVAGRAIGTETTTYVRNILKYYVTYQLTLDSTLH